MSKGASGWLFKVSVFEGVVFFFAFPAFTALLQSIFGKIYAAGLITDPDGWYTNIGFAFKLYPALLLFDRWPSVNILILLNILFWITYFVTYNFLWVRILWFLDSRGWVKIGR